MKILFLNSVGQLGGAERSLLDLLWSLRRRVPAVDLQLVAFGDGPLLPAARAMGVPASVITLPAAAVALGDWHFGIGTARQAVRLVPQVPALRRFLEAVREAITASGATIVHSNGLKAHVIGALAGPRELPLFWHIRDFVSHRRMLRLILPRMQRRGLAAIAISEAVATDTRTILRRTPVVRVLNGVRTENFSPGSVPSADLDGLAGLPPAPASTVRVGLVATYAIWKGHDLFLDAVAGLRDLPARFYIVGGPIYATPGTQVTAEHLIARVRDLRLADRVGLLSFQEDVGPVLAALDVVVQASTHPEPFGRTVAEAMAAGRAVVAPAAGGILEQVIDGQTAILFPPGDSAALRAAVSGLVRDPLRRLALGEAALTHARTKLDAERLGPEVLEAYRLSLERP